MAEHHIELSIPTGTVMNADVVFAVFSDEEKLGELRISRGSVDWRPGRARKVARLTWEQFDQLMRERLA